jgi:hypothetical protein
LLGVPNAGGRALDDRVRNQGRYDTGYRPRSAGFLYDVLKFQNLFEGAAHLVDRYPTLQTLRGWGGFLDEMAATRGWDWVAGMFEGERPHAGMQDWLERLMTAWRVSLLRTGETLPQLSGLERAVNEAQAALVDETALGPNEREFRALQWLRDSDLSRIDAIRNSRTTNLRTWRQEHPDRPNPLPLELQRMVATGIAVEAQGRLDTLDTSPGSGSAIGTIYYQRVIEEARRAADLLGRSIDTVAQFQQRYGRENIHARLEEPFTPNPALARERSVERLRRTLEEQARVFFTLNRTARGQERSIENLAPTLRQIVDRSGLMRSSIREVAPLLENRSVELFAGDEPDEELLDHLLFLRAWIDLFAQELETGPESPRDIETILDYRLYIARELGALAIHYGWGGLADRVRPVLNAQDFGFSYLILLGEWEKEPDVSLANLPADLRGNVQLETTEVINGHRCGVTSKFRSPRTNSTICSSSSSSSACARRPRWSSGGCAARPAKPPCRTFLP